MEKTAGTSLWRVPVWCIGVWMQTVFPWLAVTSAPGEGEDGACSSITAHPSSFPLFPSHLEFWCWAAGAVNNLEVGQPGSHGHSWSSLFLAGSGLHRALDGLHHPKTLSHFHCHRQCLSSSPPAPALFPLWLTSCSQAWQGCPRYTPGSVGPSLPFPRRDDLFIRYLNIVVQYPVQGWGDGGFTCF